MLKRSLKWKEAEHVFLLEVHSNKQYIYSNVNVAETSNKCYLRKVSTLRRINLKDSRVAGIQVLSLFKEESIFYRHPSYRDFCHRCVQC